MIVGDQDRVLLVPNMTKQVILHHSPTIFGRTFACLENKVVPLFGLTCLDRSVLLDGEAVVNDFELLPL